MTNLCLLPVTVYTEELHRRSVREPDFQRVRPLGVITIIRLQLPLVLLNTIRKVRGQHFLLKVSFTLQRNEKQ